MTEILFKKLRERFPPINDYERITVYEAYERVYLDLIESAFMKDKQFNSPEKIKNLAQRIFDVNFVYIPLNNGGEKRWTVIFEPIILDKGKMSEESFRYQENYSGHSIEVILPSSHPMITISTANRGAIDLFPKQRDNYYNFVEDVYKLFLQNANE